MVSTHRSSGHHNTLLGIEPMKITCGVSGNHSPPHASSPQGVKTHITSFFGEFVCLDNIFRHLFILLVLSSLSEFSFPVGELFARCFLGTGKGHGREERGSHWPECPVFPLEELTRSLEVCRRKEEVKGI